MEDADRQARWVRAVLLVFGLAGFELATWLGRLPDVRDAIDASTGAMAVLILGLAVGSIGGLTVAGRMLPRLGAPRCVRLAAAAIAVGLAWAAAGAAAGAPLAVIAAGLAVFGAGHGLCDVSMNVSGAAVERRRARPLMPWFHAAFSVGTLVGAGVAALLAAADVPLLAHALVVAAVGGAALARASRGFGEERAPVHAHGTDSAAAGSSAWRDRRTLLIGVVVLGMTLAEGSANDWLALAMVDGHRTSNAGGTAAYAAFVAAMTVGRLLGPAVLERFGRAGVVRGCAALATVGLLVLILAPGQELAFVGVVLWGFGASLGFPVGMSAAADDPARAASSVAVVATVGYVAFLAGPLLIGTLGDQVGLLDALGVVVVAVLLAGAVAGATRPPRHLA
ncbi:MAG: MFS transporter [Patulibacter minatonensis]